VEIQSPRGTVETGPKNGAVSEDKCEVSTETAGREHRKTKGRGRPSNKHTYVCGTRAYHSNRWDRKRRETSIRGIRNATNRKSAKEGFMDVPEEEACDRQLWEDSSTECSSKINNWKDS